MLAAYQVSIWFFRFELVSCKAGSGTEGFPGGKINRLPKRPRRRRALFARRQKPLELPFKTIRRAPARPLLRITPPTKTPWRGGSPLFPHRQNRSPPELAGAPPSAGPIWKPRPYPHANPPGRAHFRGPNVRATSAFHVFCAAAWPIVCPISARQPTSMLNVIAQIPEIGRAGGRF